jgi:HPt (histidine-containing phosphotransfer) domain-containing protein
VVNDVLRKEREAEYVLLRQRDHEVLQQAHRQLDGAAKTLSVTYLTHKCRALEDGLLTDEEVATIERALALWPVESYAKRYAIKRIIERLPRMTKRQNERIRAIGASPQLESQYSQRAR